MIIKDRFSGLIAGTNCRLLESSSLTDCLLGNAFRWGAVRFPRYLPSPWAYFQEKMHGTSHALAQLLLSTPSPPIILYLLNSRPVLGLALIFLDDW